MRSRSDAKCSSNVRMNQPQNPDFSQSQLFDGLGDVLGHMMTYAPAEGRDDGEVDDRIIARVVMLTEAMRGECQRRQAYYTAVLSAVPGRRGHLRLVPEDAQPADHPALNPPAPVSDVLLQEMRAVLTDVQTRIPLIQLNERQRNALIASTARPLPDDVLMRVADFADSLHATQQASPGEPEAAASGAAGPGPEPMITGGQIRAMAALSRRLEKYSVVLPTFLQAIDDLSTMMSFELKVLAGSPRRWPVSSADAP